MVIRGRRISGLAAAGAALLALTGFRWALSHPWLSIPAVTGAIVTAVMVLVLRRRIGRARWAASARPLMPRDPQRLSPAQFEHFLAGLCRRDGCRDVRVVGGANDHAADVLYTDPHGRRGLIQAKRYQRGNSVGNAHVQMVNGTYRHAHGCTHASIVTTSHFTPAARQFADHVGITLIDEARLNAWINGQRRAAPWN